MLRTERVYVSGQYPVPAETGVLVSVAIVLEFNMAMNEDTLNAYNVQLRDVNHNAVSTTLEYDAFRKRLTITPEAQLDPATVYYVFVRGNERDDGDTTYIGGVLSVDNDVLPGYYQTFFVTEDAALDTPVLVFPPDFSSVPQAEEEWENGMFEWAEVEVYATDTTTTSVDDGYMLEDTIIINGVSIVIPATTATTSAETNALTIINAINDADVPVVATLASNALITLRHNTVGSENQVVIEDLGTYNYGNLDELGEYIANPLAPPENAYVISCDDVTYDIQVDIDTTFADPVFTSSDIATLYITPGSLLPTDTQLYWRVRASTTTAESAWSDPGTFWNGSQTTETDADGTPLVSPYYVPFRVVSTSPEADSANNYVQTITVTFNDYVYYGSVSDSSITVVGKSMVSWDFDIGTIDGTVSLSSDGRSLVFTPDISFGAIIVWGAEPDSWDPDTVNIYRATARDGKYTLLDSIAYTEDGGTYTDTSVSGDDLYWYKVEYCDASGNPYPKSGPIAGRSGGFRDNQIYMVTVDSSVYSSDGSTTESEGTALGSDYTFYFTSHLYPLYINLSQLETIVGAGLLAKFSTIDIYSMMIYNSYAAYNLAWDGNLNSMEYSLQQFSELDTILGTQARYFACFVTYQTAADLLRRDKMLSGATGLDIEMGDMAVRDVVAAKGIIDPTIQAYDLKAMECLMQFSSSFYDDVANWAVRAAPWEGYYYSPYGPWEKRSWWSDKYQGYPYGY